MGNPQPLAPTLALEVREVDEEAAAAEPEARVGREAAQDHPLRINRRRIGLMVE